MDIVPRGTLLQIPEEIIGNKILLIRGLRVILDTDIAELYGIETRVLIQAVVRNIARFPFDFMFQLTKEEYNALRSQFVTSNNFSPKTGRGGRRYLPYVFTEQGVAMLSSVLNSDRAIAVNILIIRVFVKIRGMVATHQELAHRVDELERKYHEHDITIKDTFEEIKKLLTPPKERKNKRPMGFSLK